MGIIIMTNQMLAVPKWLTTDPLIGILNRLYVRNQNFMAIICGSTGSGKSYMGIELCRMIDPEFDEDHIVFETNDFVKLINHPKIHRGSAVMYDELGKGAMSREFYKTENKELGKVLQTFRHMNVATIFTVPSLSFADKIPRTLNHVYIETKEIKYDDRDIIIKWLNLDTNPRFDTQYNYFPQAQNTKANQLVVHKAPRCLLKAYEQKKTLYSENVRNDAQLRTTDGYDPKAKLRESRVPLNNHHKYDIVLKEVLNDWNVSKPLPKIVDIEMNHNVSYSIARRVVLYCKNLTLKNG